MVPNMFCPMHMFSREVYDFIETGNVKMVYEKITKHAFWEKETAVEFVRCAVVRDKANDKLGALMKKKGLLHTVFISLSVAQRVMNVETPEFMKGTVDNSSSSIFFYCMQSDDVETLKALYTFDKTFTIVSNVSQLDQAHLVAHEGGALKCEAFLLDRRAKKQSANRKALPIPDPKPIRTSIPPPPPKVATSRQREEDLPNIPLRALEKKAPKAPLPEQPYSIIGEPKKPTKKERKTYVKEETLDYVPREPIPAPETPLVGGKLQPRFYPFDHSDHAMARRWTRRFDYETVKAICHDGTVTRVTLHGENRNRVLLDSKHGRCVIDFVAKTVITVF